MSIDVKMAWRNVWRNPRRTILTVAAVTFASLLLIFMLSWQFGSYETMINASVKINTGHLQVQAKGYNDKRDMHWVVPDPAAVGEILDRTPGVEAYTYRADAFSLASSQDRTYGVLVTGIDPAREARVSTLKSLIREGEFLSPEDEDQALVGALLARNLKVGLGDEITILGQGRDGSVAAAVVKVKGIYQSGLDEFDRSTIEIPLKFFQDVYFMGSSVHEVVVLAGSLKAVPEIKKSVAASIKNLKTERPLAALTWEELMPGLLQAIEMDLVSGMIMYVFLVLVVAFSILNTFLMAIFERTREFGVMMAIGVTPNRLMKLLLIESGAMTLVGIVAGMILGCLLTLYFQSKGFDLSGSSDILNQYGISGRMYPRLSFLSATIGPALVLVITLLTALYPALRIRSLKPVQALAYN